MEQPLFRKESIEKISTPDKLNEYIKIIHPGIWMILVAVVLMLAGAVIWGFAGTLETTVKTAAIVKEGKAVLYVAEKDIAAVRPGMTVTIGRKDAEIKSISPEPVQVKDSLGEYAKYIGQFDSGDWVYEANADIQTDDGTYEAVIVIKSEKPASFLLN